MGTRDFLCQIFHDKPDSLPEGSSADLVNYNVTGLSALLVDPKNEDLLVFENKTQKPRVSLHFSLDSSGIVRLVSAEAVLFGMVQVPIKKKVKKPVNKTDLNLNETSQNETTVNDEKEKDPPNEDETIGESKQKKELEDQVEDDQEKNADNTKAEDQEKDVDTKQTENQEKDAEDKAQDTQK